MLQKGIKLLRKKKIPDKIEECEKEIRSLIKTTLKEDV